ncbi:phage replication initiation protein, NGO0469 family [Sphingomonas japonica]|uniref:Uncharacterized protein n=1 Tax=Sphingomonas japonica TaxID=511662 RepID=A0ABX0U7N3_9SPHN|nr:hypothetical protein [Sphingomonas japonica]NIJ24797.1 hypothetical protein [Sphingomonas japonica]
MALIVSDSGGGDFTPAPEGTHFGVCDMVVDLGKQRTSYQGVESLKDQIYIRWQIPAERTEWTDADNVKREGPVVIGKTYTASLGEKANLRKDLQSWRGRAFTEAELKGFDISKLLGVGATISIVHNHKEGKTYANIGAIGGLPKNMEKLQVENGAILYDPDNQGTFNDLPKWLREKIEGQVIPTGKTDANDPDSWRNNELDDDVPF